jgi:hypothetical protein
MHDTARWPQETDAQQRYMTLDRLGLEPERLDFYRQLLACTDADDSHDRQRLVLRFREEGCGRARFIADPAALPAVLAAFAPWRAALQAMPGEMTGDVLLARVHLQLGQPLDAFLASASWRTAQADIWQSAVALLVMRLAMPGDEALLARLTDVLRVGYFLAALDGGAGSLAEQRGRNAWLDATLVLPQEVTWPGH